MERCATSSHTDVTTSFRCVQCGLPTKTLYIQYSPGNIRLMKCENCKAVADEYIECEIMILIIDLILHKPKAYRHLFYNMPGKENINFESLLWKLVLICLVLDSCILRFYRMWALSTNEMKWPGPVNVASLLQDFGKMLTGVIFGNIAFLCVVFHATRRFLSASSGYYGWKQMLFVILVSSYFKIFLMAMMVWEFPSSVVFIIDIFVVSSNTVALKGAKYGYNRKC
ncbi:hypothetical protein CASFOL_008301 [Castilleja foliolosa]|uniref:Protein ARV n=1 Tax=Castilleja foliolosa TaxID=1961234 RepID=A0ABD3DYL3_9LAMI